MPSATREPPQGRSSSPLAHRGSRRNGLIKPDPEANGVSESHHVRKPRHANGVSSSSGAASASGRSGDSAAASDAIPVDQSFHPRMGRSNAPPPSDAEQPLLREVRLRAVNGSRPSPPSQEESFFHSSFQGIGEKLKACNDTLGELQQIGVSHDVQLPELVLVGDQSAGKSSLMSGLASIDLPRSEGTCTRCPLHIRVSRHSEWSCRIFLRKEYSYQPPDRDILETDVTDQDRFYPWKKLPGSGRLVEFKVMSDNAQIEDVLRWAQIAILNDDKPHGLYVPGSGSIATSTPLDEAAENTQAKFSPNVVALEIKGPEFPDLSFYDLPGIFQNPADQKDNYLVVVVRNLTAAYIAHPSAIILCAMAMNIDAELSNTFGLIRRLGAIDRTIGVLTKADILPPGGHQQWINIMNKSAHTTGLGYFITSRPPGRDLQELKHWETCTFDDGSLENWPEALRQFKSRCSVERLKAFLSQRLGEEFAKSLPTIKRKIHLNLEKVQKQLRNLPELPSNVELEIQTSLINFSDEARQCIDGFAENFNSLPNQFRECLLNMKPKITLKDSSDTPVVEISDDDSDAPSSQPPSGSFTTPKRRGGQQQQSAVKRQRVDQSNSGSFSGQVKHEESPQPAPAQKRPATLPEPFTKFSSYGRGFRTLRQVQQEIARKMTAGMPDRIPAKVYQDLALEAIKPWKEPMEVFLKQTMYLLSVKLEETLAQAFHGLKKRFVFMEAKRLLREFLEKHRSETAKALMQTYTDENSNLFTLNAESLRQYKKSEMQLLTHYRHHIRMQAAGLTNKPYVPWETLTDEKKTQEDKRRETEVATKLGRDKFERECEVVAYVRGYYRLAALRFADTISQCIICRMIPDVRRQLEYYLDSGLGIRGSDAQAVYGRLMEEDPATASKRDTLKGEHAKFERAMSSIERLEMETVGANVMSVSSGSVMGSFSQASVVGESDLTMEDVDEV